MTPKEFYDTVVKMRSAQKEYFMKRRKSDLSRSRDLERKIDNEIERVSSIELRKTEPPLF